MNSELRAASKAIAGMGYGNELVGAVILYNGTATLAKWRLKAIISEDRLRAPAYRCERVPAELDPVFAIGLASAFLHMSGAQLRAAKRAFKPRYRLVRRR